MEKHMQDLHLKSLRLKNYCGYEDHEFNFLKEDGTPYKLVNFFGPNGIGKSTLLEAISSLTMDTTGRGQDRVKVALKKYIRHKDYDPTIQSVMDHEMGHDENQMLIRGVFGFGESEYIVELGNEGWIRNDLVDKNPFGAENLKYRRRISHFIKSDSDLSMHKFQLVASQVDNFEKIISEIMRYPVKCASPKSLGGDDKGYCMDFTINKKEHLIHFKRMSAGERKITKSFSDLLNLVNSLENPSYGEEAMIGWPRILLIDNIVMHVYYDRHIRMVKCLKEVFDKQQIFATTHSGVLIQEFLEGKNDREDVLMINLEEING